MTVNYNGSLSLFHTKKYQGTTTKKNRGKVSKRLFHTKKYQGTTTVCYQNEKECILFHTKNISEVLIKDNDR